jgi:hypothetical protein
VDAEIAQAEASGAHMHALFYACILASHRSHNRTFTCTPSELLQDRQAPSPNTVFLRERETVEEGRHSGAKEVDA